MSTMVKILHFLGSHKISHLYRPLLFVCACDPQHIPITRVFHVLHVTIARRGNERRCCICLESFLSAQLRGSIHHSELPRQWTQKLKKLSLTF